MKVNRTKIQDASETPFDNSNTDFDSDNVADALKEVGVSASPGFNFGRSGNSPSGTWLQITAGVPSNRSGITVALNDPRITAVYVANQNISTFDIGIYEHEGDEINLTLIDTVSIVSLRSQSFEVDLTITKGKQLATRIVSGSANNVNVGLQLKGSA